MLFFLRLTDYFFAIGVPFNSSEQTISAVISGIPLISDRMQLRSFYIRSRLPTEEAFSFPIYRQVPQNSLEVQFLVCQILRPLLSPLLCPVPVFF